jgi:hypothetical protein
MTVAFLPSGDTGAGAFLGPEDAGRARASVSARFCSTIFVVVNAHHVLCMISDELSQQLRKPPQVEVGKPPQGTTRTTSCA